MLFLAVKDNFAVVVEVDNSDDAYRAAGAALGIHAEEVEDIDLDLCQHIWLGVPTDIKDMIPVEEDS